jgi:hypothetical protein
MSDFDRYTRVNKFEKRRKNTKLMSVFIIAGSVLVILLIGLWIFGPDDDPGQPNNISSSKDDSKENGEQIEGETTDETESGQDSSQTEETSSEVEENESSETETDGINGSLTDPGEKEQIEPASDDENVVEAYTKAWQPIGTEQQEPHATKFELDSQDWKEMESAIRYATGLSENDMITWFIENGGDQKAIGTVTNKAQTEVYRVYLSWIENQGWQPTKIEILRENDKK